MTIDTSRPLPPLTPVDHATDRNRIEFNLTNHTPDAAAISDIEVLRRWAKSLGGLIVDTCPASRERSLALTALEETTMWAVASIARATRGDG